MVKLRLFAPLLALIGNLTVPYFAAAQSQQAQISGGQAKSVQIVRTDTPPVIDGVLDEDAWRNAAMIDDLHQIQPNEYAEASQPTAVYLLYDDDALYVGARMFAEDPDQVTARILRQGELTWGDDWFALMIDPFHDHRSGYRFQTNPNGLRHEGLYQNVTEQQWEWQGIWDAAASINDEGWVAEMAIPFKTLSFDPNNDTWGMNFQRAVARGNERMGWISRNRNVDPSIAGDVVGFEGIQQGMGLDIVPSVSFSDQRGFGAAPDDSEFDPSLDVFYKLTPGLTSALTINTDFSATEVDDRQVNLSRFGLFFPEKRDFFLQDADIFEFGGLEENGRPFFSRRIGLSPSGDPVDLEVGGKISGRIGRFNIGALVIRQDEFQNVAADNAVVARVSANVLSESTVGLIVTEGNPNSSLDNSVVGIDFAYRNTRLPGGRVVETNAWLQESDTEGVEDKQRAYGIDFRMPNSTGFRGGIDYTRLEENFDPALGFVNRRGIDRMSFSTDYRYRPTEGFLSAIGGGLRLEREELVSGELQSQEWNLRLLELDSVQGDELRVRHRKIKEVLFDPFEISEGVIIPVGAYEFDNTQLDFSTPNERSVWGELDYRSGDFFTGTRDEIEVGIAWRPSGRLLTRLSYEYNDIDLAQGSFETRLVRLRTDVVFSSRLSWVNLIQYDNVSETVGINSRIHWIPEAGREAFLVLNHNLQDLDRDNSFNSSFSEASIKFNYTFRF